MKPNLLCTRRELIIGAAQVATMFTVSRVTWAAEMLPRMVVTRDPTCSCCGGWVTHLRRSGFTVEVVDLADLAPLKVRLGVPNALAACHTGQIGGYVIEGHVPAGAIKKLLAEHPKATGLAVPGMPLGSPGMEAPGKAPETYEVVLFGQAGNRTFAYYRGAQEL
ncbi:DUF411 domain-containing protein [Xanthobacter sp. DSM 24535]|jgi:hypothetical protein|uniref:Metal-binding protein n=1 Tax=Aquabacter spiritensis TaxID=933073 RepID=A0A4R3LQM7_9HYPH|nr:DUF411 domain-containing protein [Aquabacter spiritensis]TCT01909.1 hypothetical protein EDC64_116108 [Aquabacter spiritensis]